MKKYLVVFTVTIKEYFVYRLNFILWRFRVVLNLLLPLFLWTSVFEKQAVIGDYDKTVFISYLLYGNLIATFVFGFLNVEPSFMPIISCGTISLCKSKSSSTSKLKFFLRNW